MSALCGGSRPPIGIFCKLVYDFYSASIPIVRPGGFGSWGAGEATVGPADPARRDIRLRPKRRCRSLGALVLQMILWIGWVLAGVEVDGAGSCPKASEVASRLETLLPDGKTPPDRASIEQVNGAAHIKLVAPDGSLIAARELPRQESCAELALAAALLIAGWEGTFSELPVVGSPRSGPAEAAPGADANTAPILPATVVSSLGGAGVEPGIDFEPGAGLYAGRLAAGRVNPGFLIESFLRPRAGRSVTNWGLHVGAAGDWPRGETVGGGQASLKHLMVAIGPRYRLARGIWTLDLFTGAAADLLVASGSGFSENRDGSAWSPALIGGLRWARRGARFAPWLGANVNGYQHRKLDVEGSDTRVLLPRLEILIALGVAVPSAK